MRRMTAVTAFAIAALALAGCGGRSEGSETTATETTASETTASETTAETGGAALAGSVGPGFEISVDQASVTPGTYTLTVDDQASIHNFRLTGPGVDVATDVGATGTETFTVDLRAGTYTFVCDPHSSTMNGTITVG